MKYTMIIENTEGYQIILSHFKTFPTPQTNSVIGLSGEE